MSLTFWHQLSFKERTMNFKLPQGITQLAGRTGLKIKQASPEILIGLGVVGVIGVSISSYRAGVSAHERLNQLAEKIDAGIRDPEHAKELRREFWIGRGVDLVPVVGFGALSVTCFLSAHGIMKSRNAALVAAYKVLEFSYDEYRSRVQEVYGEKFDRNTARTISVVGQASDADLNEESGEIRVTTHDSLSEYSVYARFFDESNSQFQQNPEYNLLFLKSQQSYMNDLLRSRGHVFLNEVYDALGIERSSAGQVVGWVLNDDGDNYIDFGIYRFGSPEARAFVNGSENAILLDFNVDGIVYDKI